MAKERFWQASLAPTYVGSETDCGLTIIEHATIEITKSLMTAKPDLIDAPDKLAESAVNIAKTVLKRAWKG